MKVEELVGKMCCSSSLPVRLKTDIRDPGVLLAWKNQKILFAGACTVSSFEVTEKEMVIYYKLPKIDI